MREYKLICAEFNKFKGKRKIFKVHFPATEGKPEVTKKINDNSIPFFARYEKS